MLSRLLKILIVCLAFSAIGSAAIADEDKQVKPIHFTKEQQEQYFPVYDKPEVKILRKVLNAYLAGKSKAEETQELDKFSKDYYRSKFVVMSVDPGVFGGNFLTIMFQDKQDKVFTAWIYSTPQGPELKSFDLSKFDDEQVKNFQIRYKEMLEDKVHCL